ncbi:MAG: cytochrome c1 [Pseudomonadota bacterium]|nr:cytochrome c1 [Pseudomonadota bacterium]
MMRKILVAVVFGSLIAFVGINFSYAAGNFEKPIKQNWSFKGFFGKFDQKALQRGFQVYDEICSGCHSARLLAYRNLKEIGFSAEEIKKIAATKEVTDGPNDEGEMFERPGRPGDRFVNPFPNSNAARAANNGALPPDLSLIVKARKGGADYLYGLMTGYSEAPKGIKISEGMSYNPYFPGKQIAMASPLFDDGIEYADKTKATIDQMARDVSTFLSWAAEPELEERKRMGIKIILFVLVLTGMLYAIKRKIWSDLH